ncbi:MAG TPA: DUF2946 family protein [Pusillimonas sp.]|uniref:DUF2946 family protein n=1 Tax=Pusillimonas sp. TaxID=3040095 RepID=UPI002CCE38AD|nr:DUF2946 family protein [Pusillimonas sp.]HUH87157.1 DUF2946 family protein [Pusillimonas sp.]
MDTNVLAAMARWPHVPHVYGWMSLSEQGRWRLHPLADAWHPGLPCPEPLTQGESIESPQILSFIGRNFTCDEQGRWFFQNGPQRVYVRLDVAPFVLHTDSTEPSLRTHNDLAVTETKSWWIDDSGRLYAMTEHGAGLVSGRDTPAVFDALHTADGRPLPDVLEQYVSPGKVVPRTHPATPEAITRVRFTVSAPGGQTHTTDVPLYYCASDKLATAMGFVRCPHP